MSWPRNNATHIRRNFAGRQYVDRISLAMRRHRWPRNWGCIPVRSTTGAASSPVFPKSISTACPASTTQSWGPGGARRYKRELHEVREGNELQKRPLCTSLSSRSEARSVCESSGAVYGDAVFSREMARASTLCRAIRFH